MVDTAIALSASTAMVGGSQTVTASAALFAATDVGRALAIRAIAPKRNAATAYAVGAVFSASYAGVTRLYRVLVAGTTASFSSSGTTPDYDLNAPREVGNSITDGSATLKYLGQGQHCWGWSVITGFTDSTHVTVSVDTRGPFVSTSGSTRWKLGEFNDTRGWPAAMTFHQGRAWWVRNKVRPQSVWGSQLGDFENMTPTEPDGTVLATNAITVTLDDDQLNTASWVLSFTTGLAIGAASGEFMIQPANPNSGISPDNIRATRQSDRGSDLQVAPARVSGVVLFTQRGGRKVRQLEYDFSTNSFTTLDLTALADHITGSGVVESAWQTLPDGVLWLVRADGTLATLTFDREHKVRAWSRQVLGGSNVVVESVCVVPSPDGTSDDVYLAVARTFNGTTVRTIEYIRAPFRGDIDVASAGFFVDCGLSYSGTPATTFSGLNHLEGQTVSICADGSVRQPKVVTGGSVTATGPASSVAHIGLPYTTRIETLPIEAGAGAGTAQNQLKKIDEVSLRFLDTAGGRYGRDGHMEAISGRTLDMPMSSAVPLFTGDRRLRFPAGWDRQGQVVVESDDPLPLTLLAIITDVQTNG